MNNLYWPKKIKACSVTFVQGQKIFIIAKEKTAPFQNDPSCESTFGTPARFAAHALTPPRDARAQPTRPRQRQRRGTPERAGGAGGRVRGRRARASRAGSTGAWHGVRGDGQGVLSSVVRAHCSALLALGQWGDATSQRSRSRSPCTPRSGGAAAS